MTYSSAVPILSISSCACILKMAWLMDIISQSVLWFHRHKRKSCFCSFYTHMCFPCIIPSWEERTSYSSMQLKKSQFSLQSFSSQPSLKCQWELNTETLQWNKSWRKLWHSSSQTSKTQVNGEHVSSSPSFSFFYFSPWGLSLGLSVYTSPWLLVAIHFFLSSS